MLLAMDIGNTNTVIGIFEGEDLQQHWRISSDSRKTRDEYAILMKELCAQAGIEFGAIDGVVICSVVPVLTSAMEEMSRVVMGIVPLILGPDLELPITIDYIDPHEVGPDRLANAVAVHALVDGPAIVVDFGTATTFDVVTADGRYMGGAIAPGLKTSAETLFRRAALLHGVALEPPERAIGRSTEDSLKSGLIYGTAGLVDEIVRRIAAEWGEDPTVVATGGLAETISLFSKTITLVEPDLTLMGLYLVHRVAMER